MRYPSNYVKCTVWEEMLGLSIYLSSYVRYFQNDLFTFLQPHAHRAHFYVAACLHCKFYERPVQSYMRTERGWLDLTQKPTFGECLLPFKFESCSHLDILETLIQLGVSRGRFLISRLLSRVFLLAELGGAIQIGVDELLLACGQDKQFERLLPLNSINTILTSSYVRVNYLSCD